MNMPSASKLHISMACPASSYLPVVMEERRGTADRGTKLHECIDAFYFTGSYDLAVDLAKRLDVLSDFLSIDSSILNQGLDNPRTEVAFEYDTFAGEHKDYGRNGYDKFQYGKRIRGVADLVGFSSGILCIVDWKTGFGDTQPAATNWQLIIASLSLRKNGERAIGRIINTSTGVVDVAEYSSEFLDQKEKEISEFADNLNSGLYKFKYRVGEHCKYCPSWLVCPAQTTAIRRMTALENNLPITETNVTNAIELLRRSEDLSNRAERQIRTYIELIGGRLVASDGRVYVPAKADGKIKKEKR